MIAGPPRFYTVSGEFDCLGDIPPSFADDVESLMDAAADFDVDGEHNLAVSADMTAGIIEVECIVTGHDRDDALVNGSYIIYRVFELAGQTLVMPKAESAHSASHKPTRTWTVVDTTERTDDLIPG